MKLFVLALAVSVPGLVYAAPDDLDTTFQSLKEASEAKKGAGEIKKLATETYALARKAGESEKDRAQAIELNTDYALYAAAVRGPAAATVELMATLEQLNPKSKYLEQGYSRYFMALEQTGGSGNILAIAERGIAHFPNNDDLLLVVAQAALAKKQDDRAIATANRLIGALSKTAKPEGMSAAEWDKKKNAALGTAHYVAGMAYSNKNQIFDADRELRAALPLVQGNDALKGPALFQLGVVDYQIGRTTLNKGLMNQAARYSDEAAAIPGPNADQARRNAYAIRQELAKSR